MPYTAAELAAFDPELRALADEAVVVLGRYADAATGADAIHHRGRAEQIARTFELCGFSAERDVIVRAYNDLHRFVEPRIRHARDAESQFSIINYFAPEHPTRRAYEVRVAAEKRDYAANFATARTAILATVGLKLGGTALDATLEQLRTEPVSAVLSAVQDAAA